MELVAAVERWVLVIRRSFGILLDDELMDEAVESFLAPKAL